MIGFGRLFRDVGDWAGVTEPRKFASRRLGVQGAPDRQRPVPVDRGILEPAQHPRLLPAVQPLPDPVLSGGSPHWRAACRLPGSRRVPCGLGQPAADRALGATILPASAAPDRFMIAHAVRYMSVHSRKQPDSDGRTGTLPLGNSTAREPEASQLTGRFRRWWQVMDSNQRRLSRRFYRPFIPTHRNGR
jgi:hypothetical protein